MRLVLLSIVAATCVSFSSTAQAQNYYSHPSHHSSHFGLTLHSGYGHSSQHIVRRPLLELAFGSLSHVDDLAATLEALSNELCLDLYYNYAHNPGFSVTYAEAYQVLEVARYCHAAEHQRDRQAMRSQLQGLDSLFHHVQDDVRGWSRYHHRQIGHMGIVTKMDRIETALHHLMEDVGVSPAETAEQAPLPAGRAAEQAPRPAGF